MVEWAKKTLSLIQANEPCALVSLLAIEGSAPREAGTRMIVTKGHAYGTIGGGNFEYQAIEQARKCLEHPSGTWRIQDYPLGALLGQCCGGRVRIMIEHIDPVRSTWLNTLPTTGTFYLETRLGDGFAERQLALEFSPALEARGPIPKSGETFCEKLGRVPMGLTLIGGGHVGQAIVRILGGLPFSLEWHDSRVEYAGIRELAIAETPQLIQLASEAKDCVLVVTHDHALDYQLVVAALRGPSTFVGLIGSMTKRSRFVNRMTKEGLTDVQLQKLQCPIGIPGIQGKEPAIIAVSAVAQLLFHRSHFHGES